MYKANKVIILYCFCAFSVEKGIIANMIAIIGSHGSGKTTLVKKIEKILIEQRNFPFIKIGDVTRQCPFKIGKDSNEESQTWVFETQMYMESVVNYFGFPTISDRCLIDQYAYYIYWVGRNYDFEDNIKKCLKSYEKIIYLPPNENFLRNDGVRPVNYKFQKEIDRIAKDVIQILDISNCIIYIETINEELENYIIQLMKSEKVKKNIVKINNLKCRYDYNKDIYESIIKLHIESQNNITVEYDSYNDFIYWVSSLKNIKLQKRLKDD